MKHTAANIQKALAAIIQERRDRPAGAVTICEDKRGRLLNRSPRRGDTCRAIGVFWPRDNYTTLETVNKPGPWEIH